MVGHARVAPWSVRPLRGHAILLQQLQLGGDVGSSPLVTGVLLCKKLGAPCALPPPTQAALATPTRQHQGDAHSTYSLLRQHCSSTYLQPLPFGFLTYPFNMLQLESNRSSTALLVLDMAPCTLSRLLSEAPTTAPSVTNLGGLTGKTLVNLMASTALQCFARLPASHAPFRSC